MEKLTMSKALVPVDGGYVVKRTPGRVHATFEKAGAEAAKLTDETGDVGFTVLKIVGIVTKSEVTR
jgi:hypothetical protein